jgi:translation elongation factor EF-Tu-like GTPase
MILKPIEFYKVRVGFLTTEEGGRRGPVRWTFASYRPDFKMGEGNFHGAVFMDAPSEIAPGDQAEVEIAFWCCGSRHGFNLGQTFYLHAGRRVAEGTILEKGVKQYVRPDT